MLKTAAMQRTKILIKKIVMTVVPYVALPLCLLLFAGLIGFGIVVALDLWGDVYFVDGVPVATSFLLVVSIAGLVFLQPAGASSTLARFKTVAASPVASLGRLRSRVAKSSNPGSSPFEKHQPEVVTNNADFNAVGGGPSPFQARRRRVHSVVVWGKPTHHSANFNCSINAEANKKYDKRG